MFGAAGKLPEPLSRDSMPDCGLRQLRKLLKKLYLGRIRQACVQCNTAIH